MSRPLTLVSAPAGWGKSVLLSDWVYSGEAPGAVAFVGLGAEDSDRTRFWTSARAALAGAHPALAGLPFPAEARGEDLAAALINSLEDLADPAVLVLDDFHEASTPELLADLDALVNCAPASLRVVVSTRVDPALRLERLRLEGRLGELRSSELAFTRADARLLCGHSGVELDEDELDLLIETTEGWPVGVRLAAVALEGMPEPREFLDRFAGDDRSVSNYLVAEVLARQPPERLEYMLRTSIVDELSPGLADALNSRSDGRATLSLLATRMGLITPLDPRGEWYRYPRLLREVLRLELPRRTPSGTLELHRRAARWYAEHGERTDAIHHAVEGKDWDLAAEIIGEHWLPLLVSGEGPRLRHWIDRIPSPVVQADAELALAAAGLLFDAGQEDAADELLVSAYEHVRSLSDERRARFELISAAAMLYRARLRGDVAEAVSLARTLLEEPWYQLVGPELTALTLTNLGMAEYVADEVEAAGAHLRQAVGIAAECDLDYLLFVAEAAASTVDLRLGRMEIAHARASRALRLAETHGWAQSAPAARAYISLAGVSLWQGDLDQARQLIDRSGRATADSRDRHTRGMVAVMRARVLLLEGDPLAAIDSLSAIHAMIERPPRHISVPAALWEAEALLALGDPARSRSALRSAGGSAPDLILARAQLELAAGDPGAALRALAEFHAEDDEPFMPFSPCQALAVEAIALDALRDEAGALRALERALDLAEPRGFGHVLLRLGPAVRSLLRRAIEHGTAHRSLAGELLASQQRTAESNGLSHRPLLEPLSARELTVLRFLPTMLSNAEIAAELFVSPNTVKTHLKHVYRKLDVTDRRDAVDRARELHLLSPGLRGR